MTPDLRTLFDAAPGAALLPAALLDLLPATVLALLVVFARVGAFCMTLPAVGEAEVPAPVRLALALALTALLAPGLAPHLPVPGDAISVAALLAVEIAAGVFLGLMVRSLAWALAMAGQFAALVAGLSNVLVPDPVMGAHGTALSRLFGLAAAVLVLGLGLWRPVVAALVASYDLVAPGSALPAADFAHLFVDRAAAAFALALQLATPLVLAGLLLQVALGLLGRLAPQVPVFFVAQPAMPALGLGLLLLTLLPVLGAWGAAATDLLSGLAAPR